MSEAPQCPRCGELLAGAVMWGGTPVGSSQMIESDALRPVERLVLRLVAAGVEDVEIARRFRRSPEMIRRIAAMARLPRTGGTHRIPVDGLRPLERRLLRWRHSGATYPEIASRFRRSPAFVARVESLAHFKLADKALKSN